MTYLRMQNTLHIYQINASKMRREEWIPCFWRSMDQIQVSLVETLDSVCFCGLGRPRTERRERTETNIQQRRDGWFLKEARHQDPRRRAQRQDPRRRAQRRASWRRASLKTSRPFSTERYFVDVLSLLSVLGRPNPQKHFESKVSTRETWIWSIDRQEQGIHSSLRIFDALIWYIRGVFCIRR